MTQNRIFEMWNSGVDRATEQQRQRGLRKYLQPAIGGDQQALTNLYQADPASGIRAQGLAQKQQDVARQEFGKVASVFAQTKDPQMYARMRQLAQSAGLPANMPETLDDPADQQGAVQFAQAVAQAYGGAGPGGNVQSTYIDAQGNRVAIMRDGSTQVLGQNAPSNQIIDTGNGFYGVNKGSLQAAPVMVGGQPPQMSQVQYATSDGSPIPPNEQAIAAQAFQQAANGQDVNIQVPGGVPAQAPQGGALPPRMDYQNGGLAPGGQLRSAPKPISPAEQARLGIDQQRLQIAQTAAQRAAQAADAANSIKRDAENVKLQKVKAAKEDTMSAYNKSIEGIDKLLKSPNLGTLGSYTGDALAILPHTGARDARAALETIKNRVLLDTISKLKSLSATGASGFGSLSNQEGDILKNSIANLDHAQTNDAIVAALKEIRATLQESRDRVAGAGSGVAQDKPAGGGWQIEVVP